MSGVRLRRAERTDVPTLLALIRALATYERAADAVIATEADLLRDGFGSEPRFRATIAEFNGAPAGFSLWFYNYSTWLGRPGIYLEDLFVLPELRGKGIGRALLAELAQTALAEGCGRLDWQVLDWNESAIAFYESLGAQRTNGWFNLRVQGNESLRKVAQRNES
jgi:GNAT superfamily N-acetyltransferase